MEPRKLDLLIATFPYSGNGGIHSQALEVSEWLYETVQKALGDTRIGRVSTQRFSDTPITMTRNDAVVAAREGNFDLLLMVDSDMYPDKRLKEGDPLAKPFWETALDCLCEHYDRGPLVIAAPYCGPPPNEVVYLFQWAAWQGDHPNRDERLEKYTREQAARMTGIGECAALPTGLILFDVRAFELTTPKRKRETLIERMVESMRERIETGDRLRLPDVQDLVERTMSEYETAEQSWFYYEYTNQFQSQKASTEDVTATRDIAMHCIATLGYNPIRVTWDCWAGHFKVKCVDKPQLLTAAEVGEKYLRAARSGDPKFTRQREVRTSIDREIDWNNLPVCHPDGNGDQQRSQGNRDEQPTPERTTDERAGDRAVAAAGDRQVP